MQFLSGRRYIAVAVDGKVQFYGKAGLDELERQVWRRVLAIEQ